jgi:hypothetical protein
MAAVSTVITVMSTVIGSGRLGKSGQQGGSGQRTHHMKEMPPSAAHVVVTHISVPNMTSALSQ